MSNHQHDNPGVLAPAPLVYAAGLLLGYGLHRLYPIKFLPDSVTLGVALTLVVVSSVPGPWALLQMVLAKTSPFPEFPTRRLVTDGMFGISRNPIYLTYTLFYAGVAALFNALWMLLLLVPVLAVMVKGVIEREERYLERKFGDEYRAYRARVRRWI